MAAVSDFWNVITESGQPGRVLSDATRRYVSQQSSFISLTPSGLLETHASQQVPT